MGAEASRRLNFVLLGRRLARGHRLPASSLLQLSLPDEPRHTDHGLVALMRRSCLLGLAVLAPLSLASAHAFLERANPLVGSEIAASPPELSITFTEGVMMPGETASASAAGCAPTGPSRSSCSRQRDRSSIGWPDSKSAPTITSPNHSVSTNCLLAFVRSCGAQRCPTRITRGRAAGLRVRGLAA